MTLEYLDELIIHAQMRYNNLLVSKYRDKNDSPTLLAYATHLQALATLRISYVNQGETNESNRLS